MSLYLINSYEIRRLHIDRMSTINRKPPTMLSLLALTFTVGIALASPSGYSGHLQHISVPDYNPKLQFLGQHVDLPEIPTKVIRVTKTVAIKVPVPYPVKVPHHVPYPVQVNKPYPVPVTKIVKVPEPVHIPVPSVSHGGGVAQGVSAGHDASLYAEPQSYTGADYSGGFQNDGYAQNNYAQADSQGYGDFGGHADTEASINQGYANAVDGYSGHEQYGESKQVPQATNYGYSQPDPYHSQQSVVQYQAASPNGQHVSGIAGNVQNYHMAYSPSQH